MIFYPGKSAKKIIFHIGFPKTGSSALQTFLSANAAALEKSGVSYPYPEPNSVVATGNCTGNLMQIMYRDGFVERYQRQSGGRTKIKEIMNKDYFDRVSEIIDESEHTSIIFSSEIFGATASDFLKYFKSQIFDRYDVTLVGFVRDLFDYFYSSWRQQLKVQRSSLPFPEYVKDRLEGEIPMMTNFDKLRSVGLEPMLVNYDTYKRDIVGKFFEVAEIPFPQLMDYTLSTDGYNASLTPEEAALVQIANARFPSGDFPATVAKLLLRRPTAERRSGSFYSAEIDRAILSAYRPLIEEMNRNVIGDPVRTAARSRPDSFPVPGSDEIACLLEAVDIALRAAKATRPSVYDWMKSISLRKGAKLPQGFNSEAYLFHNQDVAIAGVDPGLHYLSNGRVEHRRYRFS